MKNNKEALMLADGFEEVEALLVVDILRRGKIECDIISIQEKTVISSHNISIQADKTIDEINKNDYTMVVLPGGKKGADNLRDSEEVIAWIQEFERDKKYIAAICAAPQVLQKAGILKDKKVTSYPDDIYKNLFIDSQYIEDELVVVDHNIITSRGPATTFDFAYKLLDILGGDSHTLKEQMLYNMLSENIKTTS